MGMFQKPKAQAFVPPKGAKVTYAVKYRGGRKPFDIRADADDFASTMRLQADGWAEVSRVTEEVVSPR